MVEQTNAPSGPATPPLSGPGIVYAVSRLTNPALSPAVFDEWYNEVHVPDVLATGAARAAARFRCADAAAPDPFLALYTVDSLAGFLAAVPGVPVTHALLPEGADGQRSALACMDLELRLYGLVERYEKGNEGEPERIVAAGISVPTPAAAAEVDRWYREEHNAQGAAEPGWLRSSRYQLVQHMQIPTTAPDAPAVQRPVPPSVLAIHEFGPGNRVGDVVRPLDPVTDWTKKVMADMTGFEGHVWKTTGTFKV